MSIDNLKLKNQYFIYTNIVNFNSIILSINKLKFLFKLKLLQFFISFTKICDTQILLPCRGIEMSRLP